MAELAVVDVPAKVRDASQDYDFRGESYKSFFPNLHRYPATMLPQIGVKLMQQFGVQGRVALDPFCGSGSSFIAMIQAGFSDIHGCDRNRFATLLSRARYAKYFLPELESDAEHLIQFACEDRSSDAGTTWLPPGVWAAAQSIRDEILAQATGKNQDFLLVALCEALRKCSYTRQDEFKLYRIPVAERENFRPDLPRVFAHSVREKLAIQRRNAEKLDAYEYDLTIHPAEFNHQVTSVDCILTSPPYGDSRTTVAYGQFSYFANLLLGAGHAHNLDNFLLGGKKNPDLYDKFSIAKTIAKIAAIDPARALEVSAFYADAEIMTQKLASSLVPGGWVFFVVGDRRVKGQLLASAGFFAECFAAQGLAHIATLGRKISNKVMPGLNSPSNETGLKLPTMGNEHIVVMRLPKK